MSYIETLAAARRARLSRLGDPALAGVIEPKRKPRPHVRVIQIVDGRQFTPPPPVVVLPPTPREMEMISQHMQPLMPNRISGKLSVAHIIRVVGRLLKLSSKEIMGPVRRSYLVRARFVIVYIVKECRPDLSYLEIGRRLGGRDHSTIIHAAHQSERRMREQVDFAHDVSTAMNILRAEYAASDGGSPQLEAE